jgi:hypothetical protein
VIEERDQGVVLRHSGKRVALLSRDKGRVDLLFFPKKGPYKLSCGSIISYGQKKNNHGLMIIEDNQLENIPFIFARQDIYFLHYLLEVCYFFIPVGSGGKSIFILLEEVYRNFQAFEQPIFKKMVLCKLLAHLGVCPEEQTIQSHAQTLLEVPIDNIGVTNLELVLEGVLDEWLTWCISSHPQGKWFKAMPSLIKSENQ